MDESVDYGRLNAYGAALLRGARDAIVANPAQLNMNSFISSCGTTMCIGGHMVALMGMEKTDGYNAMDINVMVLACGFPVLFRRGTADFNHPFYPLFYIYKDSYDVAEAVSKINAFLWRYGYPPNEVAATPEETSCAITAR